MQREKKKDFETAKLAYEFIINESGKTIEMHVKEQTFLDETVSRNKGCYQMSDV